MADLSFKGAVFMLLLALQFGLQPILFRAFASPDLVKSSVVLTTEATKFVISAVMLVLTGGTSEALAGWTIRESLIAAGGPAVVYAVQNVLIQLAYQNMDGLTFNLVNQTKTLFTAVCLYLVMGKRQSWQQCCALGGLFAASMLLSLNKTTVGGMETSFYYGIVPTLLASLCSGLASALSQYSLQGLKRNSFLFTMELGFISTATVLVALPFTADGAMLTSGRMFEGWESSTFIPILANSLGGIVVGLVMKHAGGVRKGFSIVLGILITSFAQRVLYDAAFTPPMMIALVAVVLSTSIHIMYPAQDEKKKVA